MPPAAAQISSFSQEALDGLVRKSTLVDALQEAVLKDHGVSYADVESLVAAYEADNVTHISTKRFLEIGRSASPNMRHILKFLLLHKDEFHSRSADHLFQIPVIVITAFLRWYERKCCQRNLLVSFSGNKDAITCEDFEKYVESECINNLSRLEEPNRVYHRTSVMAGVLLPHLRASGDMSILELLASSVLDDLDEGIALSEKEFDSCPIENWFTVQNTYFLVKEYLDCDSMQKGLLSEKDVLNAHDGILSPTFVHGVFRTSPTFEVEGSPDPHIDFQLFSKFHRAIRYMSSVYPSPVNNSHQEPACIRYVFDCIDVAAKGYLCLDDLIHLVAEMHENAKNLDASVADLMVNVIAMEILDMSGTETGRFSVDDLIESGNANMVLGILIDAKRFLQYEAREN